MIRKMVIIVSEFVGSTAVLVLTLSKVVLVDFDIFLILYSIGDFLHTFN